MHVLVDTQPFVEATLDVYFRVLLTFLVLFAYWQVYDWRPMHTISCPFQTATFRFSWGAVNIQVSFGDPYNRYSYRKGSLCHVNAQSTGLRSPRVEET
jgi:hypothetical protein